MDADLPIKNTGKIEHKWPFEFLKIFGLEEQSPCPEGLFDGCVLPKDQSNYLWKLSWISLPASLYGFWNGHTDTAIVPLCVWITSLNYWRHPKKDFRRLLDMAVVQLGVSYVLYRAYHIGADYRYFATMLSALAFYPVQHALMPYSLWASTITHGFIHILGNVGNFMLFSKPRFPQNSS